MTQPEHLSDDYREEPWWWTAAPPPADPVRDDPAEALPVAAEIVVIGSGITGLSAALSLAEAGREVVVLEASTPGWGASSRNAGFIGRTLKHSFGRLLEHFGKHYAVRVYREMALAYQAVFDLVEHRAMKCHLQRCGRFMGATAPSHYEYMARELELRRTHLCEDYEMIARAEQRREIGSDLFYGGAVIPDMGSIHPGLYQLELLDRARQAGAIVLAQTPVLGLKTARNEVEVCTAWGVTVADHVVVATNGYTGPATPWLRRRVVPFSGYMLATEALPEQTLQELLPNNRTYHDYNHNLTYVRRAPDEPRLLMGGFTGVPVNDLSPKRNTLRARLLEVFPQLDSVRLSRTWTGSCAGTFDLWPHIGQRDRVYYAMGYCFAGVPMGTYLGQKIAHRITGSADAATVFAERAFKSNLLYYGRPWFLPWFFKWYDWQDRRAA